MRALMYSNKMHTVSEESACCMTEIESDIASWQPHSYVHPTNRSVGVVLIKFITSSSPPL